MHDATLAVVNDQLEAGLDVISDGELRRQRFVYEMYDRLEGIERTVPGRKLGVSGYDMAPGFVARTTVQAPHGLGIVEELQALREMLPGKALQLALSHRTAPVA